MNQMELKRLLEKVAAGDVDVTSALLRFRDASESERAAPSSALRSPAPWICSAAWDSGRC